MGFFTCKAWKKIFLTVSLMRLVYFKILSIVMQINSGATMFCSHNLIFGFFLHICEPGLRLAVQGSYVSVMVITIGEHLRLLLEVSL